MDFFDLDTSLKVTRPNIILYSNWLVQNERIIKGIDNKDRSAFIKSNIGFVESNPGAIISFLKKTGLVDSQLRPSALSRMLAYRKINYQEYCLIHLSKESLFLEDTPFVNALTLISKYISSNKTFTLDVSLIRELNINLLKIDGNINKNKRTDYFTLELEGTGLFSSIGKKDDGVVQLNEDAMPIFEYLNEQSILNCTYQLNSANRFDYFASLEGGIFDINAEDLPAVWFRYFPNLCKKESLCSNSQYTQYITAIKTKPFVLLAGISGTGKSRIVRQLARACDTIDANPWEVQKPQNFEMIQVRPDWHDGSELLGYESRISGKPEYVVKNFVKFIVKAWVYEDENVPFFLCLDEMNLAPVEQYFAEYLSVVESRRLDESGKIVCDPLIRLNKEYCESIANEIYGASESDENDVLHLSEVDALMSILESLDYCIPLPKNLIVMGTVNMDETTFSFSRKVLDRAMTIEMNEVDLMGGLTDVEKERFQVVPEQILPNAVEGKDVYAGNEELCNKVIKYLQEVNDVLEGTPFKIAYRTRNEFLIYAVNRGEDHLVEALDEMTSMKILSRIEGDQEKIKDLLDRLKEVMEKSGIGSDSQSIKKIKEMNDRLGSGYTSYWS